MYIDAANIHQSWHKD